MQVSSNLMIIIYDLFLFSSSLLAMIQARVLRSLFHSSCQLSAAPKSALAKLRKKTGYSLSLCKQALETSEQDVTKAEKWLKVGTTMNIFNATQYLRYIQCNPIPKFWWACAWVHPIIYFLVFLYWSFSLNKLVRKNGLYISPLK